MNSKKIVFIALLSAAMGALGALLVMMFIFNSKASLSGGKIHEQVVEFDIPQNDPNGFIYAASKSVDCVASISSKEIVMSRGGYSNPIYQLFGIAPRPSMREVESGGSGVIISEDGYIITNNHVIDNASQVSVTLTSGKSYDAKIIGSDPTTDIALLKINAEGLTALKYGNSDKLLLGESVLAVGNPLGLNSTVTAGIVSAKGRTLNVIPSDYRIESFIQTDAAVNRGNSGGALVNMEGELIGINTVIMSPTGSYAGYSFAVPSSIVEKVVEDIQKYGKVQRALLGIGYSEINDDFIKYSQTGITQLGGLYIGRVESRGAAAMAGIEQGDILLSINGVKTNNSAQLQEVIATLRPGDKVQALVIRRGREQKFEIIMGGGA